MVMNTRSRTILSHVVTLHYQTCGPVGSALISRKADLGCSPATIRSTMMRLEASGYLQQPHTSAGRLPTDLGYRTYVNSIRLTNGELNDSDRQSLTKHIEDAPSVAAALENVADFVHRRTHLITFSLPFRQTGTRLVHMHLERISRERVLALWVGRGGQTFQSLLDIPESELSRPLVEKVANMINQGFSDCNLLQIHRELRSRFGKPNSQWDMLLGKVSLISTRLMEHTTKLDSIPFRGVSKVLEMPEFQDIDQIRTVFRVLESQERVKQLIQACWNDPNEWLMFFIGEEMQDPDMEGLAMILAKFRRKDDYLGCVGALGPKRMPYLQALQMFHHVQERLQDAV